MLIYAFQQWQSSDPTETEITEETDKQVTETIPEEENTAIIDPINIEPAIHESQPVTPAIEPPKLAVVEKTPVEWPIISLTGLAGRGSNGSVIINGEVKGVGQLVDGATIISIERRGAWLQYQGEKQFFRLESSSQ